MSGQAIGFPGRYFGASGGTKTPWRRLSTPTVTMTTIELVHYFDETHIGSAGSAMLDVENTSIDAKSHEYGASSPARKRFLLCA